MALVIDRKTGRKRRADPARSRAARKAARARRGKHLKPATLAKIKKALAITRKSGRTRSGRRALLKK